MASTGEVWKLGHRPALDGLHAHVAWIAPVLVCLAAAAALHEHRPNDYGIATQAGSAVLRGDFGIYAHMPEAQMGPLALLVAGLAQPRALYVVVVCLLLAPLLQLAVAVTRPVIALTGGLLLAVPWAFYALEGHADDAIVAVAAAAMVWASRRHPKVVAVAFAVALVAKPTALVLAPLVMLFAGRRMLALAMVAASAAWAPFVLADPAGFLAAGGGISTVQPWSLPGLMGVDVGTDFPAWVRPAQLFGGLALAWFVGRHRGAAAAVVAVMAWRAGWEPGGAPSYSVAVIAAAMMLDRRRLRVAGVAVLSWAVTAWAARLWFYAGDPATGEGWLRLALLICAALLASDGWSSRGIVRRDASGRESTSVVGNLVDAPIHQLGR